MHCEANRACRPRRTESCPTAAQNGYLSPMEFEVPTTLANPLPTKPSAYQLYCVCSISCRSDRTEIRIWIRLARISRSGAIEGRPKSTYNTSNLALRLASASVTTRRTLRSGCLTGDPILKIDLAEQRSALLVRPAHHCPRRCPTEDESSFLKQRRGQTILAAC